MSRRLRPLIPGAVTLGAVKVLSLGSERSLILGTYDRAGRLEVFHVESGTHWKLSDPAPESVRLAESRGLTLSQLGGARLTLTREGYKPAFLSIPSFSVLRKTLEALEELEGAALPTPRQSA